MPLKCLRREWWTLQPMKVRPIIWRQLCALHDVYYEPPRQIYAYHPVKMIMGDLSCIYAWELR